MSSILKKLEHERAKFMIKEWTSRLVALFHDESAQDLIEYALIAGLIALGAVAAASGLSSTVGNAFSSLGNSLTNSI